MSKKKNLVLLISLFFIIAGSIATSAMPAEKIEIGVVLKMLSTEFWQTLKKGAIDEGSKYPNVKVTVMASQSDIDISGQVEIVESLIIQKVDVLVVAPCGSEEIIPTLEKAKKAGIPVIAVDTDTPWEGKVCFVGTNNTKGGEIAGQYIVDKLNEKGKVAIIPGVIGHQSIMERLKGAKEVFDKEKGIEIVAIQSANSDRFLGMQVTENILIANPDLDAIFALNDQMALGALEALRNAKKEKEVILVGFDAVPEALQRIKEGSGLDATISQNPYLMGKKSIEVAVRVINGEENPSRIDTGVRLVTKENVDSFIKK
jgi:ribose transport system substrate-binding protein